MSAELIALAERCEKADGPDRELDADIAALFGDVSWKQANYTMEEFPAIRWREPHPYAGMAEPVYQYTCLIDDAMKLVPDDEEWAIYKIQYDNKGCPAAWVGHAKDDNEVLAATPALALCAAALRARAAIAKAGGVK